VHREDGPDLHIPFDLADRVSTFKKRIEELEGIPASKQILFVLSDILALASDLGDDEKLKDTGVCSREYELCLVLRTQHPLIHIAQQDSDPIDLAWKVSDLKTQICAKVCRDDLERLEFLCCELKDSQTLGEVGVRQPSFVMAHFTRSRPDSFPISVRFGNGQWYGGTVYVTGDMLVDEFKTAIRNLLRVPHFTWLVCRDGGHFYLQNGRMLEECGIRKSDRISTVYVGLTWLA
jgi:hypothetical protein